MSYKQSQFELFPSSAPRSVEKTSRSFFLTKLHLSLENLIVIIVVVFMALVVSFSLGVEKGKKVALKVEEQPSRHGQARVEVVPVKVIEQVTLVGSQNEELQARIIPMEFLPAGRQEVNKGSQEKALQNRDLSVKNDKYFTIQVASFRRNENAQREAMDLKKKGYDGFVVPKNEHVIVCVGKFNEKKEAESLLKKLKNQYKDCYIRSM